MKLNSTILLVTLIYKLSLILAFKVPNIDFQLLEDGFEVSIPDEIGIQGVFYIIQIDDTCPALMDYITEATNNAWTSTHKRSLQNNDKVVISVAVQFNDELYERTETKVVIKSRIQTTRTSQTQNINYEKSKCQEFFAPPEDLKPCKQAQTIIGKNQLTCQGELLFEDKFDDAELNKTTWKHDIRQRMYHDEEELVAFEDLEKNSYLKDGALHIFPTIATEVSHGSYRLGDRCTAIENPTQECNINVGFFYIKPPVFSAQIHTRNSFSFKYGRIEVRAKMPKGDWLFPYLMLQPMSTHSESRHAKQLRIAYSRGNGILRSIDNVDISGRHLYGGSIIWQNGRPTQFVKDKLSNKHYGDDFHNFTMVWQREKITLLVDGEQYGEIYDGLEFFNEQCFIIFGVTVGGFLNFDDNILAESVKPYKNREPKAALLFWQNRNTWETTWGDDRGLEVDYVRVFAE